MPPSNRDSIILVIAAAIALAIGGLAGIGGGLLVATGKIQPFSQLLPAVYDSVRENTSIEIPRGSDESATISVVRNAAPAVVSVVVRKEVSPGARGNVFGFDDFLPFGFPFGPPLQEEDVLEPEIRQVGGGSGFIVTSDGYIISNRHVVQDTEAQYAVVLADDREYSAVVLARDTLNDLAVLKIEADDALTVLAFGNSNDVEIGETVIAIGYALSEFRNTVTKGVISGINRRVVAGGGFAGANEVIHEAIQTDAAINPGNSGGPLLNLRGEVIGVNTAVSREGQLIGFAIPVNAAKRAVESVIAHGRIVRPWLGVRYVAVTDRIAKEEELSVDHGALIVRGATPADVAIVPDSPADRAGLQRDDVITAINGNPVTRERPLVNHIGRFKPGDEVTLTIVRNGDEIEKVVTLDEFPE
jgi:serine protease Do